MSKRVSKIVTEYIIQEIKKGNYGIGDKLPSERILMQILKVGRSSVREALSSLVDMNIVEKKVGVGVFVKKTDINNLIDHYVVSTLLDSKGSKELLEFRLILEVEICAKAAEMATIDEIKVLEEALERHKDAIMFNKPTIEADELFHKTLVNSAKNSVLAKVYDCVSDLLISTKHELLLVENKQRSLEYHQEIIEAIKTRNVDKARLVMKEHILDVISRYEQMIQPQNSKASISK